MEILKVLDKGYVRLVDTMGGDISVVNSARVSYNKEKSELDERDEGLVRFLAREGHTSPFRHAVIQFEVYAPLMVARQWWKYIVGGSHQEPITAWNESSRRYITEEPEFYVPESTSWRSIPDNSKQGSGKPLESDKGLLLTQELINYVEEGERLYNKAMSEGVCAEQARLFLPSYGMYVRWYWTSSLQGVSHFLSQRLESDSQKEIQEYAKVVKHFAQREFPLSMENLLRSK